jgi:VWFA-related protein
VVEVSIVATEAKGALAEGLKAADFRVWDDGKEQTIASFEKLDSQAGSARTKLPPDTYSNRMGKTGQPQVLSMILLDAVKTNWSDQIFARRAVETILEQIQPEERVAIYAFGRSFRTIHDFSSDKESLLTELRAYHGQLQIFDGNRPGVTLETMRVLKALAEHVKGVPGRKNLLWLSAFFPPMPNPPLFGGEIRAAVTALNNANVSVYPIDARGLMGFVGRLNVATMEDIADATGGKAYHDRNDLDRGVRLALDDTRETYLLTYSPKTIAQDGAYHSIRVRTARRGVELRYRRGYYAPGREETGSAAEADRLESAVSSPLDVSEMGIQARVEQGLAGSDEVRVVIRLDPADLNLTPSAARWTGALRLQAVQRGATGERLGGMSQAAEINLEPATYQRALEQGLEFHMQFKREPAAVSVRIGVVDQRGAKVGSLSVPLPPGR